VNRAALAHFLRSRREALRPEDVGLLPGSRRRTSGLRREELAALSGVSADYYARIEQQRGAIPSEQVIAAIAVALRLSADERDHVFRLAGHPTPRRVFRSDHVSPGMMRIFDQLQSEAAEVMNSLGEPLRQTRLAIAIFGDETPYTGPARSRIYRWFTDPTARMLYPGEDRPRHSRTMAGTLRSAYAKDGENSRAAELASVLLAASSEFTDLWDQHVIAVPHFEPKRILHPQVGLLELHAQTLIDPDQSQFLLVFTPIPSTETREKLQFLSVVGADA
jgi:transcriptional regulator with XRE-family HTH domain